MSLKSPSLHLLLEYPEKFSPSELVMDLGRGRGHGRGPDAEMRYFSIESVALAQWLRMLAADSTT